MSRNYLRSRRWVDSFDCRLAVGRRRRPCSLRIGFKPRARPGNFVYPDWFVAEWMRAPTDDVINSSWAGRRHKTQLSRPYSVSCWFSHRSRSFSNWHDPSFGVVNSTTPVSPGRNDVTASGWSGQGTDSLPGRRYRLRGDNSLPSIFRCVSAWGCRRRTFADMVGENSEESCFRANFSNRALF